MAWSQDVKIGTAQVALWKKVAKSAFTGWYDVESMYPWVDPVNV